MLDHVHFQYNGFMYGIFLLSLDAIIRGKFLKGAFFYSTLLCFKHIYLYYLPAFFGFFVCAYLRPFNCSSIVRSAKLAMTLAAVFIFSFGPFITTGGIQSFHQILARLFPFKRGLTHANWAPNFWALYNSVDFMLSKFVTHLCEKLPMPWNPFLKRCPPSMPEYVRGLVKEYSHSILPDISPQITMVLILISLVPCLFVFNKKNSSATENFMFALILSALSFFFFGWNVHEKALLMIWLPFALLTIKDPRFIEPFSLLCIASIFAQFPLLFTPVEICIKWAFSSAYFALAIFLANWIWCVHPAELIRCPVARFLTKGLFAAELYALVHPIIFGTDRLTFLPIMICSTVGALVVFYSYLSFLVTLFGEQFGLKIQKRKLIRKERKILQSEPGSSKFDANTVKHIAGIDLQAAKQHQSMAVVSLTVLSYPSMKVVYAASEVVILNSLGGVMPYLPEYLAIREAKPLKRVLQRHIPRCPKIDLLFVDSNGKWHSRGCGLACHVGFDVGLPTVGLAKNFNGYPLVAFGLCKEGDLHEIHSQIERRCRESVNQAVTFQLTHRHTSDAKQPRAPSLAILRPKSSNIPLFVSAGYHIDFDSAMGMAFACIGNNSTSVNPVRMSDLHSRRRAEEIFGK